MEEKTGGHQQETTCRREQRLDLPSIGSVVHEEKGPLAVERGAVESREIGLALRQPDVRMKRADHMRHGLGRRHGMGADSLEIKIDLGVGVAGRAPARA